MKIFLLSILLFTSISFAQNRYITTTGAGNYTGSSWANACSTLTQIPWDSVGTSANDTIYYSGGTYTSPQEVWNQGWRTYQVVIAPSWESGHNDSVKISVTGDEAMTISRTSNVKVTGLWIYAEGENLISTVYIERDSLITIENCQIYNDGNQGSLHLSAVVKPVVDGNILTSLTLNSDPSDQDPFSSQGSVGLICINNIIIYRNDYLAISGDGTGATYTDTSLTVSGLSPMTTDYHVSRCIASYGDTTRYLIITSNTGDTFYGSAGWYKGASLPTQTPTNGTSWAVSCTAHRDICHWNGNGAYASFSEISGYTNAYPHIVANNLIMHPNTNASHGVSGIYQTAVGTNEMYIYNNILASAMVDMLPWVMKNSQTTTSYINSIRFWNNTIVSYNTQGAWFEDYGNQTVLIDSFWFKNNIVVQDSAVVNAAVLLGRSNTNLETKICDIDYNFYAKDISVDDAIYEPSLAFYDYNWGEWTGGIVSYDQNSDTSQVPSSVTFTNKWSETISDWATTTGRDAGTDISGDSDFTLPDLSIWGYDASVTLPPINKDILGNDRGYNGAWDLGAIEFIDATIQKVLPGN